MTILKSFKDTVKQTFPKSVPHGLVDGDGNIESATVFVHKVITADDCLSIQNIAADYEMDFSIKSTGATHGLVIEFNK
ncbi:hypothetical protein [Winogradskyella luteola]|uniref:Uncharacterized protein n=1 Tax=Winogradskyella luteola TaxID=2828330 RepID=A0A9X1JRA3_9FLAO|nr:hypothetical protein [Winogradskyella luteola]MBV7268402.1 hypothetical protein [Winogradskyella luteola]